VSRKRTNDRPNPGADDSTRTPPATKEIKSAAEDSISHGLTVRPYVGQRSDGCPRREIHLPISGPSRVRSGAGWTRPRTGSGTRSTGKRSRSR
jgi:hypothetical protein